MFFSVNCLNTPVINRDYSHHYVNSIASYNFFISSYRTWGYSPFYHSGYLSGIFQSVDNKWPLLFYILLGNFLNSALIFNISLFIGFLILPLIALFTSRNFGFKKINSLVFLFFSIFFILGFKGYSVFLWSGMYAYAIVIFLSFYVSSLFFKYIHSKKNIDLIKLTLIGAVTFFIHPLFLVIGISLCFPIFFFYNKEFQLKELYKLFISSIIIIFLNLIWIIPFIRFYDFYAGFGNYWQISNLDIVPYFSNPANFIILLLFSYALFNGMKDKDRFSLSAFFSFLILFTLSFFGSQIGLSDIEPGRFLAPMSLLMLFYVLRIFQKEFEKKNLFYIYVLFVLLSIFLLVSLNPALKLKCGYSDEIAKKIIDFIKFNTSDARILIQDSLEAPYFSSHLSAMIPVLTSRETVSGTNPFPAEKYRFSQFFKDTVFEKSLLNISYNEFKDYSILYNIRYFLVYSENAKNFFNNSEFKLIFNESVFSIYEYLYSDNSFCFNCPADIKADYDKIEVKNALSNNSNNIVLKYHYLSTLKTKPELIIKPIYLLDDPNPFILVENGNYQNFSIYNE